jgi:hypothetical protein
MLTRSLMALAMTGCALDDPAGPRGEAWTRIDVSIGADYQSNVTAPEAVMVRIDALTAREDSNFSNRIPATITVTPDGGEPLQISDEGLQLTGIASGYEIHAVVPDFGIDLTRRIAAPTFYTVELGPLTVGGATQIRWSPANQPDVESALKIDTPSELLQPTTFHTFSGPETDVGVIDVPGMAFPRAADYFIYMTRSVRIVEDEPGLALYLGTRLGAVVATHVP